MPEALNHVSASAPLKNTKLLIVTMAMYNSNALGETSVNLEKVGHDFPGIKSEVYPEI